MKIFSGKGQRSKLVEPTVSFHLTFPESECPLSAISCWQSTAVFTQLCLHIQWWRTTSYRWMRLMNCNSRENKNALLWKYVAYTFLNMPILNMRLLSKNNNNNNKKNSANRTCNCNALFEFSSSLRFIIIIIIINNTTHNNNNTHNNNIHNHYHHHHHQGSVIHPAIGNLGYFYTCKILTFKLPQPVPQ